MKEPKAATRPKYTPTATLIATLPGALLQILDSRLRAGESGQTLLAWFNALPETVALRNAHLQGREFTSDDILAWEHEQMLGFAPKRSSAEPFGVYAARADPDANRQYLNAITAHYADLLLEWAEDPMNHHLPRLKLLERGVKTMLAVRRAELQAERQRFQQEKAASPPPSKSPDPEVAKSPPDQPPPPSKIPDPPPPPVPASPSRTPAEAKFVPSAPSVPSPPIPRKPRPGYSVGMIL